MSMFTSRTNKNKDRINIGLISNAQHVAALRALLDYWNEKAPDGERVITVAVVGDAILREAKRLKLLK